MSGAVALEIVLLQVVQEPAPPADELQQPAARVVVLAWVRRCSVSSLMRRVSSAIWTSGEPVSVAGAAVLCRRSPASLPWSESLPARLAREPRDPSASGARDAAAREPPAAGSPPDHPATAEAGLEILAEGGTAADAAVAASLASCVAETVMTGLARRRPRDLAGRARPARARTLDFFVAVPGLGGRSASRELDRARGAVRRASSSTTRSGSRPARVPGVPAGLDELWQRARTPARGRASSSRRSRSRATASPMPPAHAACLAMLAPVMTMRRGRRDLLARGRAARGRRPAATSRGSSGALELVAEEGRGALYTGTLADALLGLMDERGGLVTPRRPRRVRGRAGASRSSATTRARRVLTRGGLSPASPRRSPRSRRCAALAGRPRARARSRRSRRRAAERAHDEPRHRRRGRERLRPHDEPRPRLGRLPARPRHPPEQHARRDRPARRRRSSPASGWRA